LIIGLKNQIPNDAHRSGHTQVELYPPQPVHTTESGEV
jgi:hypothetical protein